MSVEELVYKLRTHSDPYQTIVEAADKLEELAAQLLALRKWRQEYVGKLTIAEAALAERDKEIAGLRESLEAIIARSYNDPLGTSKVIDMRRIAEDAARRTLEAQEKGR